MKSKRLLAIVLSAMMLFSMFSVAAFATEDQTDKKYTFKLTSGPSRSEPYYDYEKFDPTGITVTVTDNATGSTVETVSYSDSTAYRFKFSPKASAYLSVDVSAVDVTLDGQFIESIPVTVNHRWEPNTSLDNRVHGTKCFGCGEVQHDTIASHTYDDTAWVPNNDGTFAKDNTESNFCTVCEHEIVRDIDGSAGYDIEFEEYQFLHDIMSYIEVLLDMIFGSIKR